MHWYLEVLKKYAVFDGRARRKEYWMYSLFNIIITVFVLSLVSFSKTVAGRNNIALVGAGRVLVGAYLIYLLATLIPHIAVGIRRMHDIGRSGWWILFPIVSFVLLCLDGQPGENKYGPNPKTASVRAMDATFKLHERLSKETGTSSTIISNENKQGDITNLGPYTAIIVVLILAVAFYVTSYAHRDGQNTTRRVVNASSSYQSTQNTALLQSAAQSGDANAQYNLGYMYVKGQGVPQDYAKAAAWFRKAAEQGNANAQYSLGHLYDYGQGVPQDDAQAAAPKFDVSGLRFRSEVVS